MKRNLKKTNNNINNNRVEKTKIKNNNIISTYYNYYLVLKGINNQMNRNEIIKIKRILSKEGIEAIDKFNFKFIKINLKIRNKDRMVLYPVNNNIQQLIHYIFNIKSSTSYKSLFYEFKNLNIYWNGYTSDLKEYYDKNKKKFNYNKIYNNVYSSSKPIRENDKKLQNITTKTLKETSLDCCSIARIKRYQDRIERKTSIEKLKKDHISGTDIQLNESTINNNSNNNNNYTDNNNNNYSNSNNNIIRKSYNYFSNKNKILNKILNEKDNNNSKDNNYNRITNDISSQNKTKLKNNETKPISLLNKLYRLDSNTLSNYCNDNNNLIITQPFSTKEIIYNNNDTIDIDNNEGDILLTQPISPTREISIEIDQYSTPPSSQSSISKIFGLVKNFSLNFFK